MKRDARHLAWTDHEYIAMQEGVTRCVATITMYRDQHAVLRSLDNTYRAKAADEILKLLEALRDGG